MEEYTLGDTSLRLGAQREGKLPKGTLPGAGNGIYPDLGGGDTYIYTYM